MTSAENLMFGVLTGFFCKKVSESSKVSAPGVEIPSIWIGRAPCSALGDQHENW